MRDNEDRERERDLADYDATTSYFRTLVDVRFKLLALIPVVTGAAIAWSPRRPDDKLALAALGLIVTFALALYDERNTEVYDALKVRAKCLEAKLGFSPEQPRTSRRLRFFSRPLPTERWGFGGAFLDRPLDSFAVSHTMALALVYGAVLGAWVYVLAASLEYRFHWLTRTWLADTWVADIGNIGLGFGVGVLYLIYRRARYRPRDNVESLPDETRNRLNAKTLAAARESETK
jgi:hypothetical protein